jgi:DNA-binding IclR family transcriptional regulator
MSAPEAWHVTRTMRSLELLAVKPRSAVEVANVLGVHPRTARRLLNRLVVEGYVTRGGPQRRQFAMTLKLVSVAGHALERADLVREALPFVQRLRDDARATARLSVPSYRSAMPLVHEEAADRAPLPQLGRKLPCHACAPGKALLAYRTPWCEAVLTHPLEAHTERTIIDAADLLVELAAVRERGYAAEHDEFETGSGGIAAPVFDHNGEAIAALGIDVPAARVLAEEPQLARAVTRAAAALSEALGYVRGLPAPEEQPGPASAVLAMVPAARSYAA